MPGQRAGKGILMGFFMRFTSQADKRLDLLIDIAKETGTSLDYLEMATRLWSNHALYKWLGNISTRPR